MGIGPVPTKSLSWVSRCGAAWSVKGRASASSVAVLMLAASFVAAAGSVAASPGRGDAGTRLMGWDTYRRLDRLPYLSADTEALRYSSFDRSGGDVNPHTGNDNGSGGCLRSGGVGCVVAEDTGAGEVDSIWFTRDRGVVTSMGRIRIELDGRTVIDAPLQSVVDGKLGAPFVFPLVADRNQSPGGVYIKVPMPYRTSMRVSVESNLKYYHVDYRHFPDSDGVPTFDRSDRADDVLALLRSAGTRDPKPARSGTRHDHRTVSVLPGATVQVAALTGSASIAALRLRVPKDTRAAMSGLRLGISFDGRRLVDSPVGEFFGSGLGSAAVRSLMFAASPGSDGWLSAWWPMPFARDAMVTLTNTTGAPIIGIGTDVAVAPDPRWGPALSSGRVGYFTALSHAGPTTPGQDWIFADEHGHGKFVGVNHTMRGHRTETVFSPKAPTFLEGADRVYVDGSRSPQLYGTGTEDLYKGGWYFMAHLERKPGAEPDHLPPAGIAYSAPFTGMPAKATTGPGCVDYCVAAYRLMIADSIDYRSGLRFGIEHGKRNLFRADYSSTAFLYTHPADTIAGGDELDPTDSLSRVLHGYGDSGATEYGLNSAYEGTADTVAVTGKVRATTAPVVFRLYSRPDNRGIRLRRTADQAANYQSARVLVDGVSVGTWQQPRKNTVHRWLDDSYALPASATVGKLAVTVTLIPDPERPPWTAARYKADPVLGP